MAIGTVVKRGENSQVDSGADLTVTLDQALTAGQMSLCSVFIGKGDSVNPVAPTSVTGGGVTWTLHRTYAYDVAGTSRATLFLYRALAVTPSGTSVVVDYADTPARTVVSVVEWPGADTGGTNGADAFSATNIGEANGTANLVAATVTTLASAGNAFLAVAVYTGTTVRTWTPDTDPVMSEIVDYSSAEDAASNASGMSVSYNLGTVAVNPTIGATCSSTIAQNAIVVFELVEAPTGPTVTSVSANSGTVAGGTSVTITGEDFDDTGGSSEGVTFGGTAATSVVFVNSTTITCTTPAHAAGAVNVVVTNGDGQSGTGTNAYFYEGTVVIVNPGATNASGNAAGTLTSTLWSPTGMAKYVKLTPTIGGVVCDPRCVKLLEP
jgi:hypothetical protein